MLHGCDICFGHLGMFGQGVKGVGLGGWKRYLCYGTSKLQNLPEISWLARVLFVFLVGFVLFEGSSSYKEMPQHSWSI